MLPTNDDVHAKLKATTPNIKLEKERQRPETKTPGPGPGVGVQARSLTRINNDTRGLSPRPAQRTSRQGGQDTALPPPPTTTATAAGQLRCE